MNIALSVQKRCKSFETDTKGRLFVDVSINWASNRYWQTIVPDTWKGNSADFTLSGKCYRPSNALVYIRDRSTHTIVCAAALRWVGCLLACLTSQQQASVSQGRVCSDNCTCCHTEIEVAGQTFHLTQSQYTDTRPTSPSADL